MNRILGLCLLVCLWGCGQPGKQPAPVPVEPPKPPADAISTIILHDIESTKVFSNKLFAITKDESVLIFTPNNDVYPSSNGVDEPFHSLVQTVDLKDRAFHGTIFIDDEPSVPYRSKTGWKLRFGDPAPGTQGVDYAVLHIEPVNLDAERKIPSKQTTQAPEAVPAIGLEETRLPGPKP